MAIWIPMLHGTAHAAPGYQSTVVAITKATIVVSPDQTLTSATLIIRDGLISQVGENVSIPAGARVIDGNGLFLYPGFIDAGTTALLKNAENAKPLPGRKVDYARHVLAGTRNDNRRGLTPEWKTVDHLKNSEKEYQPFHQSGITTAQVIRQQPILGGQSCVLELRNAPLRETVIRQSLFSTLSLAPPPGSTPANESYPMTLMGTVAHLRQVLIDAERYRQHHQRFAAGDDVPRPAVDPVLEALLELKDRGIQPLLFTNSRDDLLRALVLCAEQDWHPTILTGGEAWRSIMELQQARADVILRLDFGDQPEVKPNDVEEEWITKARAPLRVQRFQSEQWQRQVRTAKQLDAAGVRFAFSSLGLKDPSQLLDQVRTLIGEGLTPQAALKALTLAPAQILGMESRLGTLEPGKLGHVVLMTGPLEEERAKIRSLIVGTELIDVDKNAQPVEPSPTDQQTPDLAGSWNLKIRTSPEETTEARIDLTQISGKLTGTFESSQGDGRITNGKVTSEGVSFDVEIGAGDGVVRLRFSADWKPPQKDDPAAPKTGSMQQMQGQLKTPFGAPASWTAKRVKQHQPEGTGSVQLSLDDKTDAADDTGHITDHYPSELPTDRILDEKDSAGDLLIKGGTILTGLGETIENGSILIQSGKITAIGKNLKAPKDIRTIDAAGKFVMPGMVDTHSHIMIDRGVNESSQSIVCEVSIQDAIRTDDPREYRALAGGLTTARLLHGSANVIGGQHAVVKLKHGTTAAEHLIPNAPLGVKFALGENVKYRSGRFPDTRMGVEATLKRAFYEALDYRRRWREYERARQSTDNPQALLPPRRDLRLETLAKILDGEAFIHCHCYRADEILMLIRIAEQLGIRIQSLQHVLEGYKIAPEIVAHGASCSTFADWWAYKVEAYDATPYNTTLLNEAGANIVVKSDNAELMRHMNLEAAKSLKYGNMPADDALKMVTINAARELGLEDQIGSLEVGKDGDVAIFNGHPLNAFARCEMTIIEGRVYFDRSSVPTAMSEQQQSASAEPPPLSLAPAVVRERILDLPRSISGSYAIVGATIHPVDRKPIRKGTLLIVDGKIARVGPRKKISVPDDAAVIQAQGLHVYPGLIDTGTTLGITEIGRVDATRDFREGGKLQPDLRAGIAVNVDSELIPVARAGGITTALIRPQGGIIAGQCSLFQTAGWTSEQMVLNYEAGLSLNWPSDEKEQQLLKEFLEEARRYDELRSQKGKRKNQVLIDPRFEALRPYLHGERPVMIEAHGRQAIAEAIKFAEDQKFDIVITGATDAWKLASEIKQRNIPVIVGPTMRAPIEDWDPQDATYANPGRLHEAGILFAIRSDHAANSRNAPLEAAIAVAYGLPEREALKAVTLNAARVLGIEDQTGSLTVGKRADLIITDGSPLQHTTQIKGTFVGGVPYAPDSRQIRFFHRYRQRLAEQ